MKTTRNRQSASALVITLAFIVLIAVLVVGLMETTRTGTVSSNSYLESMRAELFAEAAVDRVVGTLRLYTSNTDRYWVSQPGLLIVSDTATRKLTTPVPLSSGTANPGITDSRFRTPSLNVPMFQDASNYTITRLSGTDGNIVNMAVKWIYVRADGSVDPSESPGTSDAANPIVGRYAYWTDDECSKINYNLAWRRPSQNSNPNPPGHPANVDLTALSLTESMADAIHHFITADNYQSLNHGFFNTPEDARRVPSDVDLASVLETNKFDLTHYNNSPDTTFFNEPRIMLTTQERFAPRDANGNLLRDSNGTPYFLDILNTANTDPGSTSSINVTKLNATVAMLMRYLQRTDWPMISGSSSFQNKYYGGYSPESMKNYRLIQLAINIIDYVRSKESTQDCVLPIRAYGSNNQCQLPLVLGAGADASSFIGVTRAPCITEIGIGLSSNPVTVVTSNSSVVTGYQVTYTMEVFLPENYGLSSVNLAGNFKVVQRYADLAGNTASMQVASSISAADVTSSSSGKVKAGEYALVTQTCQNPIPLNSTKTRPAKVGMRMGLSGADIYDIAPLIADVNNFIPFNVDAPGTASTESTSIEIDDPRVNKHAQDWKQRSSGHSFGKENSCSTIKKKPGANFYGQDTDGDGNISNASLYMPPPKGKQYTRPDGVVDDNTLGVVTSVGELGYIHTGTESSAKAGTPWRTFHLQPSTDAASVVPDWALMDLFTVPSVVLVNGTAAPIPPTAQALFTPNNSSVGGQVNVNSHVEPFGFSRVLPLAAVLKGCRWDSTSTSVLSQKEAENIAQNIYDRVRGANGKMYEYQNAYYSRGQVVEISSVADHGEQSEELVRQISNLITARSNVFMVYAIGQALKQTASGGLATGGESRIQAMVERYLYNKPGGGSEVRYRTLYYRRLAP